MIENLAIKIKNFVWDYDTYEYFDTFGSQTSDIEVINHFENMLQNQDGIESLIAYCNDVLENELLEEEKDLYTIDKINDIKRELERILNQKCDV